MCRCRATDTCVDPIHCVVGENDGGNESVYKIETGRSPLSLRGPIVCLFSMSGLVRIFKGTPLNHPNPS